MLTIGIQISYERQPWNIKARIDNRLSTWYLSLHFGHKITQ